jgi:predicted Zn-dependent peptidase
MSKVMGSEPTTAKTQPPALGPQRPVAWPARTAFRLPNGMQVVLAERRNFPRVRLELFFRSGNAAAVHHLPGLAEMTATVVRAGTESRGQRQIDEDLRRMGADLGTSAGADTSAIAVSGLAEFLPNLADLVADLARKAVFPERDFERERRQKLEELRIARTTSGFLGSERMRAVLFGRHPYSRVAPTEKEVEAYRREDLTAFYAEHYAPENSLFVAVGDFDIARAREIIEKQFANWKGAQSVNPATAAPPELKGRHVHLVDLPDAVQAEVLVGNRAITRRHPDWPRLVLANSLFGGAFNSRLVMNIREQKGYTYSPRSTAHALREYGYFTTHAAVRNEVTAATLTEIFYEMDRMRSLPVGADELDDAKNYVTGAFSLGVATLDGVAGQVSSMYVEGMPEDYLEKYRDKIQALTSEEIMAAARSYFDSANAQIVVVGDAATLREQAKLFGPVTEWTAEGKQRD